MHYDHTNYVLGFVFNPELTEVTLILKNKPAWQAGFWNGVGGKIESTDKDSSYAMSREFYEETGVNILPEKWKYFGVMGGKGWDCALFVAITKEVPQTTTEESVRVFSTSSLPENKISNTQWLVPLAKNVLQSGDNSLVIGVRYLFKD